MPNGIIATTKDKMSKAVQSYRRELATIRAGRANASLLDKVSVDYYGVMTPINQLASISVPEARMLVIQPYDKSIVSEIEKAIMKSDLGINPTSDGTLIRIVIPALTEERRKELVRLVRKEAEDAKIVIRNIRRDGNEDMKKLERDGDITEDNLRSYSDDIQKLTDDHVNEIDQITKAKEDEVMEV